MIKVYHVQIGEEHYYFGSKKAIYDVFNKEQVGIGYTSLRNVKNLDKVPYSNKKCVIREGFLIQSGSSKRTKEDVDSVEDVKGGL